MTFENSSKSNAIVERGHSSGPGNDQKAIHSSLVDKWTCVEKGRLKACVFMIEGSEKIRGCVSYGGMYEVEHGRKGEEGADD